MVALKDNSKIESEFKISHKINLKANFYQLSPCSQNLFIYLFTQKFLLFI